MFSCVLLDNTGAYLRLSRHYYRPIPLCLMCVVLANKTLKHIIMKYRTFVVDFSP